MTEQLCQILAENGIQCLELRSLRPPDAEIPVHKLTLEGSRLGAWQALKNLTPKTGFYPVHLNDEYLEYIIENAGKLSGANWKAMKRSCCPTILTSTCWDSITFCWVNTRSDWILSASR